MIDDFFDDWSFYDGFGLWIHFLLFFEVSDDSNDTVKVTGVMVFDAVEKSLDIFELKGDSVFYDVVKLINFSLSKNRCWNWMLNWLWDGMGGLSFTLRKEKLQIREIWFNAEWGNI